MINLDASQLNTESELLFVCRCVMSEQTNSHRILVVEDSPTQARILRKVLESEGYQVESVPDGETAVEKLASEKFDLVLSDVMMPGMSGYELCKKIKSNGNGKIPVVLITALHELKDLVEGLRSGAENFITKPYEPSYLLMRIKSVLENNNVTQGPGCDPATGVCFMDKAFLVNLDKKRILDYLVSTVDDYFRSRQREHETKLTEAQYRIELAEERERFLASLAKELKSPLECADETLRIMLDGGFGNMQEQQVQVLQQVQRS